MHRKSENPIHGEVWARVPASMSEHQALTQPVEVLLEDPTLPVALAEPRTNLFKQTAYRPQMIDTTPRVYVRQPIPTRHQGPAARRALAQREKDWADSWASDWAKVLAMLGVEA